MIENKIIIIPIIINSQMDYTNKTREFNTETQVNTETWDYTDGSKGVKISYWNENRSVETRTYMNGNKAITKLNSNGSESYHMEYPPQPEMPRIHRTYAPSTYIEPEPKKPKKPIGRPPLNKPKVEIEKKPIGRPPLNKPIVEPEKKTIGRPKVGRTPEALIRDKLLDKIRYKQKYHNLVFYKEDYINKNNEELELYITQLKK